MQLGRRDVLVTMGAALVTVPTLAAARARQMYAVCGGPIVRIRDAATHQVVWEWDANHDPNVGADVRASFKTTADCKWVDGDSSLLVVSSHDGVAIIDRATRRASFVAQVGHAHSADVTPGGIVLVAGSDGERGGDVLAMYDRRNGRERLAEAMLDSAHGVVFDHRLGAFWALGRSELRLVATTRSLSTLWSTNLPTTGGHDLIETAAGVLVMTTDTNVYTFDTKTRQFRPHRPLYAERGVKSVSVSAKGRLMVVRADDTANGIWWTQQLRFLYPVTAIDVGERIYKARWSTMRR